MRATICLMAGVVVLSACSRRTIPVRSEHTDTTRLATYELREERVRFVPVSIALTPQRAERTVRDSTSTLQTDVARSTASILPDGSLYHTLENKPATLTAEVPVIDTYVEHRSDSSRTLRDRVEVPVRMPLRWWERLLCWVGGIVSAVAAGWLLGKIVKTAINRWLKPI